MTEIYNLEFSDILSKLEQDSNKITKDFKLHKPSAVETSFL